ncbi:MAG: hypothetical protein WC476_12425 [Phycisphaerae bacterium]|jgi:hypothetical protein
MNMLREQGFGLKKTEYQELRQILQILNPLIHEYNQIKKKFFNIRSFIKHLRNLKDSAERIEKLKVSDNSAISILQVRTCTAILLAFFAYTPFIKCEILLRLSILLFQCLAKLGISFVRKALNYLTFFQNFRDKLEREDGPCNASLA